MPSGIYRHRLNQGFQKGYTPKNKGKKGIYSEEVLKKLSDSKLGSKNPMFGKKMTEEAKEKARIKLRIKMLGNKNGIGNKGPGLIGSKNPNWIIDRSKLKTDNEHQYDTQYKIWMLQVKERDNWKCRINDNDCKGKLEAHHILPWSQFPQLRYNINNGISLCHFHHPRKKNDEIKLVPVFQELVLTTV